MEQNRIEINREPSFYEIWHEGKVVHEGKEHQFWLIHPKGIDINGNEYEIDSLSELSGLIKNEILKK